VEADCNAVQTLAQALLLHIAMSSLFNDYQPGSFFDEMFSTPDAAREHYAGIMGSIGTLTPPEYAARQRTADAVFLRQGVTFTVYNDDQGTERIFPFDCVPRVISAEEWDVVEKGLIQRITALNLFLHDIYHEQKIIKDRVIPPQYLLSAKHFRREFMNCEVPKDIYVHICGSDLIRDHEGRYLVLEDNLRCPSGASYMLENREIMMRMFPDLFRENRIEPVDNYPQLLRRTLASVAPAKCDGEPTVVILTPGHFNSAYYEHSFLADLMGVELVEGQDLFVEGEHVWMRTTEGPRKVDVIYRRIDDAFIDPLCFRPDSMLGIPGLMDVYRSGGVSICSAPGAGVADDKAVYTYVPEMIRFYLGEEPILQNVPTWQCGKAEDCKFVLENLGELVVKEVHGSGGYGMLVGPKSTAEQIASFAERIRADPGNYIAQPTLALSTVPTFVEEGVAPRHVDLRPYCLVGERIELVPGGLTRVALKDGSLVVNSSQGGGVKDTWVLAE
jgi:uncharacterized circularly permuted ATP-grasp superfamily protein